MPEGLIHYGRYIMRSGLCCSERYHEDVVLKGDIVMLDNLISSSGIIVNKNAAKMWRRNLYILVSEVAALQGKSKPTLILTSSSASSSSPDIAHQPAASKQFQPQHHSAAS